MLKAFVTRIFRLGAKPLRLLGRNSQWLVPDLRQSGRSGFLYTPYGGGPVQDFHLFPRNDKKNYTTI